MKTALIDTDILSAFLRGEEVVIENADKYLEEFGRFNISIITYYEILNGLLYKDANKQLKSFRAFIKLNKICPLTILSVKISAKIQADLRKTGAEIGHTDTLIAGVAIANKMELITNNTRHFSRIKGLKVANWKK
ncbi:MAG: type II toxin-antitoxin system VapC family toxin [Chitinophagaceae bacterium]